MLQQWSDELAGGRKTVHLVGDVLILEPGERM
jgi:hypothetical protein